MGLRELMRIEAQKQEPPEQVNSLEYLQRSCQDESGNRGVEFWEPQA